MCFCVRGLLIILQCERNFGFFTDTLGMRKYEDADGCVSGDERDSRTIPPRTYRANNCIIKKLRTQTDHFPCYIPLLSPLISYLSSFLSFLLYLFIYVTIGFISLFCLYFNLCFLLLFCHSLLFCCFSCVRFFFSSLNFLSSLLSFTFSSLLNFLFYCCCKAHCNFKGKLNNTFV